MYWTLYNLVKQDSEYHRIFDTTMRKIGGSYVVNEGTIHWIGWDGHMFQAPHRMFCLLKRDFSEFSVPDQHNLNTICSYNSMVVLDSWNTVPMVSCRQLWFVQADVHNGCEVMFRVPHEINHYSSYTVVGSDKGIVCKRFSMGGYNSTLLIWNSLKRKYPSFTSTNTSMYCTLYDSAKQDWEYHEIFDTAVRKIGGIYVVNEGTIHWICQDGHMLREPHRTFCLLKMHFNEHHLTWDKELVVEGMEISCSPSFFVGKDHVSVIEVMGSVPRAMMRELIFHFKTQVSA
ncbi:hypothetical protein PIB30_060512 [Stylosanthes scabra]|uniref:F-box associated domain-containing protein n=1 Tax=Stylosanthes scabra TaxID=79078 RepID=A0ABU6ZJ84_9FABA|nr:hypothetical protein [Stylosanthes scabra]